MKNEQQEVEMPEQGVTVTAPNEGFHGTCGVSRSSLFT